MDEDDFLVEAARWARYQEKAEEIIQQIQSLQLADAPPREIIDNPQAFRNWIEQCRKNYEARTED